MNVKKNLCFLILITFSSLSFDPTFNFQIHYWILINYDLNSHLSVKTSILTFSVVSSLTNQLNISIKKAERNHFDINSTISIKFIFSSICFPSSKIEIKSWICLAIVKLARSWQSNTITYLIHQGQCFIRLNNWWILS